VLQQLYAGVTNPALPAKHHHSSVASQESFLPRHRKAVPGAPNSHSPSSPSRQCTKRHPSPPSASASPLARAPSAFAECWPSSRTPEEPSLPASLLPVRARPRGAFREELLSASGFSPERANSSHSPLIPRGVTGLWAALCPETQHPKLTLGISFSFSSVKQN